MKKLIWLGATLLLLSGCSPAFPAYSPKDNVPTIPVLIQNESWSDITVYEISRGRRKLTRVSSLDSKQVEVELLTPGQTFRFLVDVFASHARWSSPPLNTQGRAGVELVIRNHLPQSYISAW